MAIASKHGVPRLYTLCELVSCTLDEHQQDDQQVLDGTLTVIQDKLFLPIPWDQTPQYVELAAGSLAFCTQASPHWLKAVCCQQPYWSSNTCWLSFWPV